MNALVYRRSPLGCMGYEWRNFDKKNKSLVAVHWLFSMEGKE